MRYIGRPSKPVRVTGRPIVPGITLAPGAVYMQKACGFAACDHCESPETCSLNQLGIGSVESALVLITVRDLASRTQPAHEAMPE